MTVAGLLTPGQELKLDSGSVEPAVEEVELSDNGERR